MKFKREEKPSTYWRVVVIISVVAAFVSINGCGSRNKPSMVIENLIRTVERGEIDEAAKFNSQGFISRNGIDSIKESLRQTALWIKRDGGIKSIEVLKEESVGDVAEVVVKVTRGGGDFSIVYYKLIWEQGDWKVDGVVSEPTSPGPASVPT